MTAARNAASMTQQLQDALVAWVDRTLDSAELGTGPARCSAGPLDDAVAVVPESVSVDRIQEVGADFNLAGVWGSSGSAGSAPDAVPEAWSALGIALRRRVEQLVRGVLGTPPEDPVPQPRLLPPSALPAPLRAWYEARPPRPPAGPGWPTEPWVVDGADGGVRLPLLFWSTGYRLAVQYSIHPARSAPDRMLPALAALSTAVRLERGVDVALPPYLDPEGLEGLVDALGSVPGDDDLVAMHAAAVGDVGRRVAITPVPGDASSPRLTLTADLLVGRGARLLPGSAASRRISGPARASRSLGRAGS